MIDTDITEYYLFARLKDGSKGTFIQSLIAEKIPAELSFMDHMAFERLCSSQNADLVGTIRVRIENGERAFYHSFIKEPVTKADELLKAEALLRIYCKFDENAARRIADDAAVLTELGGD
jgi:hypothetical protein